MTPSAPDRESPRDGFLIPQDVATCPDCLTEILDPANRRFRYPFTTCAACGPRYTILRGMPFSRSTTGLSEFRLCPECQAEVADPLDRRFQSSLNTCPWCGPQVELVAAPDLLEGLAGLMDDVARAAALIKRGRIAAIKGSGGFYLACDATNGEAIARLRVWKSRTDQPLALMMSAMEMVRQHCQVSPEEAGLLQDPSAPITLLFRRPESKLAPNVAPNNPTLGVMLPATPLVHLLARDLNRPLVITSGNLPDLPVIADNDQARERLAEIADAFLIHNQGIEARCEDSVWWVDRASGPEDAARQPIRRGRGDAPYSIRLPWRAERPILAVGADTDNAFCLVRGHDVVISPHNGAVSAFETLDALRASVEHVSRLSDISPAVIAHDLHPGALTTRLARLLAEGRDHALVAVQHHHAHIAACLAEHGRDEVVIGLVLDGTGYGPDGTTWGGEILTASVRSFERAAHLETLPLAGGDTAFTRPYRIAWGYLFATQGEIPDIAPLSRFRADERRMVAQQIESSGSMTLTSSCGRLFDAVAALAGVCTTATFEAQASLALEAAARRFEAGTIKAYPFSLGDDGTIRLGEMLAAIVADVKNVRKRDEIAAAFHQTVVEMFGAASEQVRQKTGLKTVTLSGSLFQNRLLLRLMRQSLRERGFEVLTHRQLPPNDGGLALGQAVIALRQPEAASEPASDPPR